MKPVVDATSAPLSSIFGSGFLIIVPVLAGAVGAYSVLAMAGVCALAFAVGSVNRFNIKHAEPVLASKPGEATLSFERCSDLALVFAYVISVSLYLHILSSFVLGGLHADTELNENLMTTAVIALIMVIGVTKGLKVLSVLERWGLYITLLIISLLLFGFASYDWTAWQSASGIILPKALKYTSWEVLTIVAGTLIVVQGFETTRYLGGSFDAETRVRASRWSQIISTAVYLIFVALALPVVHTLNGKYDDNSLITLTGVAASALAVPLIVAAALSQFSAAVADTLAATGNLQETTHGHLKSNWGCVLVGGGAIALTWSASTLEIVAIASRAFAFYYLLQCFVAISVSKSVIQRAGIAVVALVLAFITVFAVPAS
ncbi:hypothetical protein [Adhaeretor mobilis]|uniref:Amino acid permease n=1 Tax=Adhaeretor mobilis TaxID=1930276 RepID=A0A517MRQ3_9BACT|nr:hypothetical protein [Adhaeretor mobilis]QDS97562.1 hypothetical protein HG15A2_08250 [Adhaeretor mobilis]